MAKKLSLPFTLVVEAYACDEYGDSPAFAVQEVDQAFLDNLVRLSKICQDNDLHLCSQLGGPSWDQEAELNLRYDSLQVTKDNFWWEASPKHADYHCETRGISIEELLSIAAKGELFEGDMAKWYKIKNGTLYFSGDYSLLDDLIDQHTSPGETEEVSVLDCMTRVSTTCSASA